MNPSIGSNLQRAMALIRGGQFAAGEQLCQQVLRGMPNQPDALHLLAMSAKQQGRTEIAERYFRDSIRANPRQPAVLANLGNLLDNLGRQAEAIDAYKRAVQLEPGFLNCWINLGHSLLVAGRPEEAVEAAETATRLAPQAAATWELLGLARQKALNETEAEEAFRRGLEIEPGRARIWYSLGVMLQEIGRFDEAIAAFRKARQQGLDAPQLYRGLAEAYYEARKVDEALATYDEAIQRYPQDSQSHFVRAKFRWESGQPGDHLAELKAAIAARPQASDLWGSYFDLLGHQGRFDEILKALAEAERHCPEVPRLRMAKAVALSALERTDEATVVFEEILAADPDGVPPRLNFAEHLLSAGDYERAEALCAAVLEADPLDIKAWTFRGTAWQLMGDERADWLLDFERMVCPVDVPLPEGYSERDEYFDVIRQELEELHRMQAHPLDQTLRGGTQTNGFLFRLQNPLLKQLGAQMKMAVRSVLATFPKEPDHPFWGRNTGNIQFSGAWSVRLRSQGYHTNHFHPEGWISSALYIALPDVVHSTNKNEGYIQFGEPVKEMRLPLKPVRLIEPEVGRLVLFPSYMWHGTIPFTSEQPRITVAYDLIPAMPS